MSFKFEKLEVWQTSLDYIDDIYAIASQLPKSEEFNLKSQITRAATSIALNIAEGSTGQSDAEFARFLGMAIRSLVETVACQKLIERRGYLSQAGTLPSLYTKAQTLISRLQALRNAVSPEKHWLREEEAAYEG